MEHSSRNICKKMLGRGFSALAAAVLVSVLLSSVTFGAWDDYPISGSWNSISSSSWNANTGQGNGETWFFYEGVLNFSAYKANVTLSTLNALRANWWDFSSEKHLRLLWNFSGVHLYVDFEDEKTNWGVSQYRFVHVGSSNVSTAFTTGGNNLWWNPFGVQTNKDDFGFFPSNSLEISVFYVDAESLVRCVVWNHRADRSSPVLMLNTSYVVAGGWRTQTVQMRLQHEGLGYVNGWLDDEIVEDGFTFTDQTTEEIQGFGFWDFVNQFWGSVTGTFPAWLKEAVDGFASLTPWFWEILASFWSMVLVVLPFMPYILGLYVLDAVTTSVSTGSIQPIGNVMLQLYGLASGLVGVIVGIADTIYSFIKFW